LSRRASCIRRREERGCLVGSKMMSFVSSSLPQSAAGKVAVQELVIVEEALSMSARGCTGGRNSEADVRLVVERLLAHVKLQHGESARALLKTFLALDPDLLDDLLSGIHGPTSGARRDEVVELRPS